MQLRKWPTLLFAILATLLLSGAGKCFGQDKIVGEKVLVIQRVVLKSWQKDSVHCSFIKGNRVSVTKINNEIIVGKMEIITDSTILIKGKEIKINEIKRISRFKGVESSLIGASIVAAGSAVIAYEDWKYKKYHEGLEKG